MSAQALYDALNDESVDGVTITQSGSPLFDHGYYVGGVVPSLVNPSEDDLTIFLATCETDHVGLWRDRETGNVFVDSVDWISDERYAVRLAQVRNELAVWDITRNSEIRV